MGLFDGIFGSGTTTLPGMNSRGMRPMNRNLGNPRNMGSNGNSNSGSLAPPNKSMKSLAPPNNKLRSSLAPGKIMNENSRNMAGGKRGTRKNRSKKSKSRRSRK